MKYLPRLRKTLLFPEGRITESPALEATKASLCSLHWRLSGSHNSSSCLPVDLDVECDYHQNDNHPTYSPRHICHRKHHISSRTSIYKSFMHFCCILLNIPTHLFAIYTTPAVFAPDVSSFFLVYKSCFLLLYIF